MNEVDGFEIHQSIEGMGVDVGDPIGMGIKEPQGGRGAGRQGWDAAKVISTSIESSQSWQKI